MEEKIYTFNAVGVCTNPDRIDIIPERWASRWQALVSAAKWESIWVWGLRWTAPIAGESSPCSRYGLGYPSREAALSAAFERVVKSLTREGYPGTFLNPTSPKAENIEQLSLF